MNKLTATNAQAKKLDLVLMKGDLSQLTPEEMVSYNNSVCASVGLNPLTRPFEFIKLNGKLVLYAKRDATDQLRKVHSVSIKITGREILEGIYVVTALAKDATGREDESTGAVSIDGLKGENRANAMLKAETKAKRRVTLSICGLGLLDETEIDSIPNEAKQVVVQPKIAEAVKQIAQAEEADMVSEDILEESDPADYVITFGKKLKGKKLKEVKKDELESFCNWLREQSNSEKGLSQNASEMLTASDAYLSMLNG